MNFKGHFIVLDTSALLFDPASLTYFSNNTVVIPVSVLQELDKHKDRLDEVGSNARTVNRKLYEFKKLGSLNKGVKCQETNVTIRIFVEKPEDMPDSLDRSLADNRILSVCLSLASETKAGLKKVHLVTNDLNLGLRAEAYGVDSFEFQPEGKYVKTDYYGNRMVEEAEDLVINDLYTQKIIQCPARLEAFENEFFLIKNSSNKKSGLAWNKGGYLHLVDNKLRCGNIKPKNIEQTFALSLLLDPNVSLVTLTGLAGSGKTLLSIAAGISQTLESNIYDRLVFSRSLVLLSGKDKLGYLKGGLKEKLEPYLLPMRDAVDQVLGENSMAFDYLTANATGPDNSKPTTPKIEVEPLQYIRGRSLRGVFFIIDEAQNLTLSEVKAIISRAGEGSKVVLLGDVHQIDNPYLSKYTNGISQVIERFRGSKIAGHISLKDGVRSELATEAANRL